MADQSPEPDLRKARNLRARLLANFILPLMRRRARRKPGADFDPWQGNTPSDENAEKEPPSLARLSEIYVYIMLAVILVVCVLCYVLVIAPGSR